MLTKKARGRNLFLCVCVYNIFITKTCAFKYGVCIVRKTNRKLPERVTTQQTDFKSSECICNNYSQTAVQNVLGDA